MDEINEEFQSIIGKIERQIMFDGAPPVHPAAVAKTSREIRESLTALALRAQQAEQRAERAEEKVGKLAHAARRCCAYIKDNVSFGSGRLIGMVEDAIAEAERHE